jgi:nitroreductase
VKVGDFMTTRVVTVHPDSTIGDAARLMLDCKISGLPVVGVSGRVVGIVTEHDLLRRQTNGPGSTVRRLDPDQGTWTVSVVWKKPLTKALEQKSVMDIIEAIYNRRAVREYTVEPVDEKPLRQLVDAAVQAPSAVNQQPWLFCIVSDRMLLARISREAKAQMLRTSPAGLLSHHFHELLSDPNFDIFYAAPALIVISAPAESPWAVEDCALAAENLMLAAHAAGLGTCWIGFAQSWLRTAEGKAALDLSASSLPVTPIIVGHPKSAPQQVPRKPPEIRWIGS